MKTKVKKAKDVVLPKPSKKSKPKEKFLVVRVGEVNSVNMSANAEREYQISYPQSVTFFWDSKVAAKKFRELASAATTMAEIAEANVRPND